MRATPFWRDERVVRILLQAAFLVLVAAVVGTLYRNMMRGLGELGLTLNLDFLRQPAGFGISEGIAYSPGDSYGRAFWVGVVNTVRVVTAGIVLASAIGLVVGIARLSSNWLVRNIARAYVEAFRNIPLLLQLLFWYGAVILKLPPVRQAISFYDAAFLSQRGLYLPRPVATEELSSWLVWTGAGAVLACIVYGLHRRHLRRMDRPGFPSLWALPVLVVFAALGWLIAGAPLLLEYPQLQRFNFTGGMYLSPEFTGLLLGLSVYTGAFIAEVVRGGIQAVDKGQREAAAAMGLRPWQVTYFIVLPQALRIIIPPVTSQYLNLTKNSSLAVAIGYPEIFNIGTTTMNQSGQTIPVFGIIIASYLAISLVTSLFMNWYNRRMRLIER